MAITVNLNVKHLESFELEMLRQVESDLVAVGLQDNQNMTISKDGVTYYDTVKDVIFGFRPFGKVIITQKATHSDYQLAEKLYEIVRVWLERMTSVG